jgi:hypothetical protein
MVVRTLLDYLRKHEVAMRGFDAEAPNGTLQRFYPDVRKNVDVTAVADRGAKQLPTASVVQILGD